MVDETKPRHTAKVIAECDDLQANFCLYLAHPFDESGHPTDPQPTEEESADLEDRAQDFKDSAEFWRSIAPDLPRQ